MSEPLVEQLRTALLATSDERDAAVARAERAEGQRDRYLDEAGNATADLVLAEADLARLRSLLESDEDAAIEAWRIERNLSREEMARRLADFLDGRESVLSAATGGDND